MSQPPGDPGWRPAAKGLLYVPVLPFLFALWARRSRREPRLVLLRTVFVAVAGALPLMLWSVAALDILPEGGIPWWGWVVLTYPVVGTVFFARSTRAKVMAAETLEVAATRFLAGSFVVLGLACAPALFGHSLVYIGGGTPAAVVGTALSAILLVSTAPTRARLARFETELADRGRPSGIVSRLMRPQPPDPS